MKKHIALVICLNFIHLLGFSKTPCRLMLYSSDSSEDTFAYHSNGSLRRMESKIYRGQNKFDFYEFDFVQEIPGQITEARIKRNGSVPIRNNSFIGDTEKYQWENGKLIKVEGFFKGQRAYLYLFNYDTAGNISQLSIEPFGQPKFVGKYEYDPQNNPVKISFSYGNEVVQIIEQEFGDNALKAPVHLLTESGLPFHPITGAVWEKHQMTKINVFIPNSLGQLRLIESGKLLDNTTNRQGYVTAFTYLRNTYREQRSFLITDCE